MSDWDERVVCTARNGQEVVKRWKLKKNWRLVRQEQGRHHQESGLLDGDKDQPPFMLTCKEDRSAVSTRSSGSSKLPGAGRRQHGSTAAQ